MPIDPDRPDPQGAKPPGVSDATWYGYQNVDSSLPLSVWKTFDSYYDPTATGHNRYRSNKVDSAGNPIQGLMEKPPDAPEGMTALGQNMIVPINDPRVQAAWNPAQSNPTPSNSTSDPYGLGSQNSPLLNALLGRMLQPQQQQQNQGQDSSNLYPQSSGNPLQDAMMNSFAGNQGMFKFDNGREGRALSNGGLLWDDNGGGLDNWGAGSNHPTGGQDGPWGIPTNLTDALTQTKAQAPASASSYAPSQQQNQQAPYQQQGQPQQQNLQPFQVPAGITPTQQQQADINYGQQMTQNIPRDSASLQSWAQQGGMSNMPQYPPQQQQQSPQPAYQQQAQSQPKQTPPQQQMSTQQQPNSWQQMTQPNLNSAWQKQFNPGQVNRNQQYGGF